MTGRKLLLSIIVCPECNGDGWVEDEYSVGGYTPDRWMEIRAQKVECEVCGGWGEVSPSSEAGEREVDISRLGKHSNPSP
jgi:uncharacterized protein YbaR (Trm112 family)